MTTYFISGLGADERAFQRIRLPDSITIKHVKWIKPFRKESLKQYVVRISEQIDQTADFSLVGLSFGGLIAIELAKFLKPQKVILISSFTNRSQLQWIFRAIGKLKINLLVPGHLLKSPNAIIGYMFGVKNKKDREMLRDVLKDTSPQYLYWSINQILNWKNSFIPNNLYHIHGAADRLLPCKRTNPTHVVPRAGHLMVLTHAAQVSWFLNEIISSPDVTKTPAVTSN